MSSYTRTLAIPICSLTVLSDTQFIVLMNVMCGDSCLPSSFVLTGKGIRNKRHHIGCYPEEFQLHVSQHAFTKFLLIISFICL